MMIDQKCHSCAPTQISKLRGLPANLPNLKGPRPPSQHCKKKSMPVFWVSNQSRLKPVFSKQGTSQDIEILHVEYLAIQFVLFKSEQQTKQVYLPSGDRGQLSG